MVGLPQGSASRMGMLVVNPSGTDPGFLETEMRGPGWWIQDMSPLWSMPAERGANDVIPGLAGRMANPKRIDETTYVMAFHVTGSANVTGGAPVGGDSLMQLHDNLAYLRTNVGPPNPLEASYRDALLRLPDDTELMATVQCRVDVIAQRGCDAACTLRVTVLEGEFT